jgi:hypothetical protein
VAKSVMSENESERVSRLEERVEQLEWRRRAGDRSKAVLDSVVPHETREHLRAAGREQLLAARSLLDHWIGRLEERPADRPGGREDIRIE